jgi:hypothetical protein
MPPRSDLYLSSGRMRRTAFLLPLTTAALTPIGRCNGAISGGTCSAPPVRQPFRTKGAGYLSCRLYRPHLLFSLK